MRRSAAPSVKSDVKRQCILPKLMISEDKDINNFSLTSIKNEITYPPKSEVNGDSACFEVRSNEDILNLIEDENIEENILPTVETTSASYQNHPDSIITNHLTRPIDTNTSIKCIFCTTKADKEAQLFSVVWCKRSSKKHKTWEGDGYLVVKSRSASLKDLSGKVIDKGMGYKLKEIESLEDGSKLFVGGKECEIQYRILSEEYESGKYCECKTDVESPLIQVKEESKIFIPKKFYPPINLSIKLQEQKETETRTSDENNFFLPAPSFEHQQMYNKRKLPVTDVFVDSFLSTKLRLHQKEGISFIYKCIMGFQNDFGQGVILADEMGLGKTLQCIALIWTLFKRGPYGGVPILKKVIIITPSSLVKNWQNEFFKWLGKSRLSIYSVNQKNTVKDYVKYPKDVLIISYDMFLRSSELLSAIPFDLVVCDEGHRIKNLNVKISSAVNCLSTSRRILLTGTPIQNDLAEFFSLADFVNPGVLGSVQSFRKCFEKPIAQARNQDCTEFEAEVGEERSEELNKITKLFMLRRTQEVINQYLPPKVETVVFCKPSELQIYLYNYFLKSRDVTSLLSSSVYIDTSTPLVCIDILRKLCNHPCLLLNTKDKENDAASSSVTHYMESAFSNNYKFCLEDSGKLKVLEKMLIALFHQANKEKVVIVSTFTKTLDILEKFCKNKNYEYLRLDGSTNTSIRQDIVDSFNRSFTKYTVFLLSSKAGGVGLNLIGASRIVLYDIDWNPANDLQAMSRIWRDGQKRQVYVYRLLTTGTIEEKMFQRQLSKQCLSGSVLDSNSSKKLRFSHQELKDLFTLHENTKCITHEMINCDCMSLEGILELHEESSDKLNCSFKELKNIGMAELMNWTHICGPISLDDCSDVCLASGGQDISFIFQNVVNAKKPVS